MRGEVIDIQQIFRDFFPRGRGRRCSASSGPNYTKSGEDISQSSLLSMNILDFRYVVNFPKSERISQWSRKMVPNFLLVTPSRNSGRNGQNVWNSWVPFSTKSLKPRIQSLTHCEISCLVIKDKSKIEGLPHTVPYAVKFRSCKKFYQKLWKP